MLELKQPLVLVIDVSIFKEFIPYLITEEQGKKDWAVDQSA